MNEALLVLIICTSLWVAIDANRIGVKKGLVSGLFDMGPTAWFLSCLLFWIVAFPAYLIKRGDYRAAIAARVRPVDSGGASPSFQSVNSCPHCRTALPHQISSKFCPECGKALLAEFGLHPAKRKSSPIVLVGGGIIIVLLLFAIATGRRGQSPGGEGGGSLFESSFEIRVEGTAGAEFQGSYMVVQGGTSTSKSVDGTIPAKFFANGVMVSTAFQKKSESGALLVSILRDGKMVKQESTGAAYGMVSIASQ